MIVRRIARDKLLELSGYFPVVSLNGPRQSGKTTLIKNVFPDLPYVSMEDPDNRLFAESDAMGFLQNYTKGAIFDEAQRSPHLFSYIQGLVDSDPDAKFVLSGSQNFLMSENISQTLAGRIGLLTLLPFSVEELKNADLLPATIEDLLYKGFYPRVYDKKIPPDSYYPPYLNTYIERDLRLIKNIGDLSLFTRFMKLCAGRAGQIINYNDLANDTGISVNTVKSWLSVLEASYIIFTLPPYFKNFNKRLIKSHKLYFYDTGLLCELLQITKPEQLQMHFARGGIFENFVLLEILKSCNNRGIRPSVYFWQSSQGKEIDILLETGGKLISLEVKSGKTFSTSYFDNLRYWQKLSGSDPENSYVMYAGDKKMETSNGTLLPWDGLSEIISHPEADRL